MLEKTKLFHNYTARMELTNKHNIQAEK